MVVGLQILPLVHLNQPLDDVAVVGCYSIIEIAYPDDCIVIFQLKLIVDPFLPLQVIDNSYFPFLRKAPSCLDVWILCLLWLNMEHEFIVQLIPLVVPPEEAGNVSLEMAVDKDQSFLTQVETDSHASFVRKDVSIPACFELVLDIADVSYIFLFNEDSDVGGGETH